MTKQQPRGVQEVSTRGQLHEPAPSAPTIRVVADDRMSDRREVHANLMRAPGMEVRPQQISRVEARQPGEVRPRRPSLTDDRHALSVSRVARDRLLDREAILVEVPPRKRRIATDDAPCLELSAQYAMRPIALRDEEQAGCLLVQPMNDSLTSFG